MGQWHEHKNRGAFGLLTRCCLLAGLTAIAPFSEGCAAPGGASFREYADAFVVPEVEGVPELTPLPEDVYRDALAMKEADYPEFIAAATQILRKYHRYYIRNFCQSYSFVSPKEFDSEAYLAQGNNKFFVLREFMRYYDVWPCSEDLMHSTIVEIVLRERASAPSQMERGDSAGLEKHAEALREGDFRIFVPGETEPREAAAASLENVPYHLRALIRAGRRAAPLLVRLLEDESPTPYQMRGTVVDFGGGTDLHDASATVRPAQVGDLAQYALERLYDGYGPLYVSWHDDARKHAQVVAWREMVGVPVGTDKDDQGRRGQR